MKILYLFIVLFALSLDAKAQESVLEKTKDEYKLASEEDKVKMDSLYQPIADKLQKQQIKTIGGVPFGISHDKAEIMLRNKFGRPDYNPSSNTLSFKNIKYGGRDFDAIHFLFQSDGVNTYLNACIFITNASSLSDAIEKEKNIAENVLSKYDMQEYEDSDGNPTYTGGMSPLWNGDWKTIDFMLYGGGIHTDILKYKSDLVKIYGVPYAVRIIYGPYDYVKEEF